MLNFKCKNLFLTSMVWLGGLALLSSCNYTKSEKLPDAFVAPKNPVIDTHVELCGQDPNMTNLINGFRIDEQIKKRPSVLSGVAGQFKEITKIDNVNNEYLGLEKTCDFEYSKFVIDCDGTFTLTSANKTETLSLSQLSKHSLIYTHEADFCGTLPIDASKTLFIRADTVTLKDFSIVLGDNSLLSISTGTILQAEQFKDVTWATGSVLSINVEKENTATP
jgi:hypothetical protein